MTETVTAPSERNEMLEILSAQMRRLVWADFDLVLRAQERGELPGFLGSALRGSFGHAFKETVCMVTHRECAQCLLKARCPYTYVFETPRPSQAELMTRYETVPHPFVLLPASPGNGYRLQPGQTLEVGFRLFGPALELLPYFLLAWEDMAQRGLGVSRLPFVLQEVRHAPSGEVVFTPGGNLTHAPAELASPWPDSPLPAHGNVRLRIETPLRMMRDGKPLQQHLPFETLITSLLRRLSMVLYFHHDARLELDFKALSQFAAAVPARHTRLVWQDLPRWSNRQKQKMNLGGLAGEVVYGPEALPFVPLLRMGEILLAGKNTSFGLGRYRLDVLPALAGQSGQ